MADLAGLRGELERRGAAVVVVHQGTPEEGAAFADRYPGVETFHWVADPDRAIYQAFGLGATRAADVVNPHVVLRGVRALARGHTVGKPIGDAQQMPGALAVRDGQIAAEHHYRDIADRPDYLALVAAGAGSG